MASQSAAERELIGRHPHLAAILPRLRQGFEELYGDRLVKLILYGSQARGDALRFSDIDILVVLKGPVQSGQERHLAGGFVSALCLEFDAVVQCFFVDQERFASADSPLLENISREGIEV